MATTISDRTSAEKTVGSGAVAALKAAIAVEQATGVRHLARHNPTSKLGYFGNAYDGNS